MVVNGPVSPGDLFFFYGTLKQGAQGAPDHLDLASAGSFLGPASIRGDLYHLGDYPGVIRGRGVVHGTRFRFDDLSILAVLDDYEGVTPELDASLYLRRLTPLIDRNREPTGARAWVYWYNQSVQDRTRIENGVWPG